MKTIKTVLTGLLLTMSLVGIAQARGYGSSTSVRGYTTRGGTYVAPHRRTMPDSTKSNNWSTRGNTNPYTGKAGSK